MDFAANLKRICAEKGTTPTNVCKELNLSTSKVSAWYNGSLPKQPVLLKLAQALDCTVMDFFADEDAITQVKFALDEDEKDIIRLFRKLPRREKHEFMSNIYRYEEKITEDKEE